MTSVGVLVHRAIAPVPTLQRTQPMALAQHVGARRPCVGHGGLYLPRCGETRPSWRVSGDPCDSGAPQRWSQACWLQCSWCGACRSSAHVLLQAHLACDAADQTPVSDRTGISGAVPVHWGRVARRRPNRTARERAANRASPSPGCLWLSLRVPGTSSPPGVPHGPPSHVSASPAVVRGRSPHLPAAKRLVSAPQTAVGFGLRGY